MKIKFSLFWKYLLSYLAILMIPILIGSVGYKRMYRVVEEDAKRINATVLENAMNSVDQKLEHVRDLTRHLGYDAKIKNAMQSGSDIKSQRPAFLYEILQTMDGFDKGNVFIDSIYIFMKKPDMVLTTDTIYGSLDKFYGGLFVLEEYTPLQWEFFLYGRYHNGEVYPALNLTTKKVYPNEDKRKVIPFIQSLPVNVPTQSDAHAVFFLDNSYIEELLSSLMIDNGGWAYISNSKGEIITGVNIKEGYKPYMIDMADNGEDIEIDGEMMTVTKVVSPKNGWTYVAMLPSIAVKARVSDVHRVINLLIAIISIIGLILSLSFAYRYYNPMRKLVGYVSGKDRAFVDGHRNSYDYLRRTYESMYSKAEDMETEIKEHQRYLYFGFMERLLDGNFNTREEIKEYIEHIDIDIVADSYQVMMVQILPEHEQSVGKLQSNTRLTVSSLQKYIPKSSIMHLYGNNTIITVLRYENIAPMDRDSLRGMAQSIKTHVLEEHGVSVILSFGKIVGNLMDIYESRTSAESVMEYKRFKIDKNILFLDELPNRISGYHLPYKLQKKLLLLLRDGNREEIKMILNDIYHNNVIDSELSYNTLKQLVYEIRGILLKSLDLIYLSSENMEILREKVMTLLNEKNPEKVYKNTYSTFMDVCDMVDAEKEKLHCRLKQKIMSYMEENFLDANISLSQLATEFDITEVHLSRCFKDYFGLNFSSYLEEKRMDWAKDRLVSTNMSIESIALGSGYNSSHAFRRAFKRSQGITPNRYREDMKENGRNS